MNNTNQILIEKYIEGKLTVTELADFELKLKNDAGFAKEVAELQNFVTAMQVFGRDQLKSELQAIARTEPLPSDIFAEEPKKKDGGTGTNVRNFSYRRLIGIAAAIVLIATPLLLLVTRQSLTPTEAFNTYFEAYPNVAAPVVRNGAVKTSLEKAMQAYEQKAYPQVISQLSNIQVEESKREAVNFYLAMAYLANKNPAQAQKRFQTLRKQSLTTYKEQVDWYLALAYLANKEATKGKKLLKEIVSSNSFYQKKAKEVLRKL